MEDFGKRETISSSGSKRSCLKKKAHLLMVGPATEQRLRREGIQAFELIAV